MKTAIDVFSTLQEAGWINAAFIIGSAAVILAIVGQIKDSVIPLSRSLLLGLFGAILIAISTGGFLLGIRGEKVPTPAPNGTSPAALIPIPSREAESDFSSSATPIREHFSVHVGTGLLAQGAFSDGEAPYTEEWLWQNDHFNIQVINPDTYPEGCDVSRYNTNLVWIGGSPGMKFIINDQVVGQYETAPNSHGYIFEGPVRIGDTLCAVDFSPAGFHIILGPDIYYHYDSYCYRGNC
jgi:hypothetical protein